MKNQVEFIPFKDIQGIQANDILKATDNLIAGELSNHFTMLDPALSALFEDLQRATMAYATAQSTNEDMTAAKWRLETAQSAYHTRLLELRKNALNKKIAENDADVDAKCELHEMTMQQRMNENFNRLREKKAADKKKKEKESQGDFFFYFVLGLALAQLFRDNRSHDYFATPNVRDNFLRAQIR
jgi:hypothetical protein